MKAKYELYDFDFKDWEKAFQKWDELKVRENFDLVMTICQDGYISGYWITVASETVTGESIYTTDAEVQALKQRVIAEIERAKIEGGSPKLIT